MAIQLQSYDYKLETVLIELGERFRHEKHELW